MLDNLGDSGQQTLHRADTISADMGHDRIGVEHVFLGVMDLQDLGIERCFQRAGVDAGALAAEVKQRSQPASGKRTGQALFTPEAETMLDEAAGWASSLGSESVEAPHILLAALLDGDALPAQALADQKADVDALVGRVKEMLKGGWDASRYSQRKEVEQSQTSSPAAPPRATSTVSAR